MEPIVIALVAIGGSIFGIWLGHQFQSQREDRRWRLDQKLQIYTSFHLAVTDLDASFVRATRRWPETMEEGEKASAKLVALFSAEATVRIVGNAAAIAVVAEITEAVAKNAAALSAMRKAQLEEGTKAAKPDLVNLADLTNRYVAAVRKDLGFRS